MFTPLTWTFYLWQINPTEVIFDGRCFSTNDVRGRLAAVTTPVGRRTGTTVAVRPVGLPSSSCGKHRLGPSRTRKRDILSGKRNYSRRGLTPALLTVIVGIWGLQ